MLVLEELDLFEFQLSASGIFFFALSCSRAKTWVEPCECLNEANVKTEMIIAYKNHDKVNVVSTMRVS